MGNMTEQEKIDFLKDIILKLSNRVTELEKITKHLRPN